MSDPITRLNAALEGRYRIERELGEGGMATVYLALDERHNRNVALKVLKPELAAVVGAERFLAEIETTANLQHPHIVALFDSGEADGFLFYVMPYVVGESLRERLDREHQLPVDEAVGIATNVAEALDYAHSQGVIHRDIKPANILMQAGKPVVSDFGIALAVGAAGGDRLTETGLSLGTPHYMSPEQATGDHSIGPAADLYALGCVLYEMLIGEPPHTGRSAQAVLAKILSDGPGSVRDQRRTVPAHVDAAVRKALEKLPADRFPNSRRFGDALGDDSFRYGEPVVPRAPMAMRPRWVATAGVALLVAGAFGWGAFRYRGANAPALSDRSIAVLPFENRSSNPEDYFSDGFADQLINALLRIPDLRVTSRASSFAFRGGAEDVQTIAERLRVANLVSGSVQQSGDRVLVTAQLIEARSGFTLWSDSFDRDLVNIIDLQEEVALAIADGLRIELSETVAARVAGPNTASREAHDQYLRGRQLFYQRTPDGLLGALRAFGRSLQADSLYVPTYVGVSMAYGLGLAYAAFPPSDSLYAFMGRAFAYADRAIDLDSANAEAYAARGFAEVASWSDPDVAARDLARAVELQPSSADALGWYGVALSRLGHHEEALARNEQALQLDPVSPGRRVGYVFSALSAHRPDLALEQVRRARTIQPELGTLALMYEALSLLLMNRADQCLALDLSSLPALEATCLLAAGQEREASDKADSLARAWSASRPYVDADGIALYHAWAGKADEALTWVERALDVWPFSYSALLWPPGIWDRIPAGEQGRVKATIERLRTASRDRVLAESRRARLP